MATYGVAVLALLVAITIAVAHDAILVMLKPEYLDAARVIPYIAVGMALQGVYLLTSIGLNLTSRTKYYPIGTFAALPSGSRQRRDADAALRHRPARRWRFCSRPRRRPSPSCSRGGSIPSRTKPAASARRRARASWPHWLGSGSCRRLVPIVGLAVRAIVTTAVFAALLGATGFFRKTERAFAAELIATFRRRKVADAKGGRMTPDARGAARGSARDTLVAMAAIAAVAIAAYLPALATGFTSDDFFILARVKAQNGLAHPLAYFTSG